MKENILAEAFGFDWDDGNLYKNANKHNVSWRECEEIFFNEPILFFEDFLHSEKEKRAFVLGKTNEERRILIVFTMRNQLIRVISARDMSKKERKIYETASEQYTHI